MKWIVTTLLLCSMLTARAGDSTLNKINRIIITGDANSEAAIPVLNAIKNNVAMDEHTLLLFTGDNVTGPGDHASIDRQVALTEGNGAEIIYVPGQNEWANGGRNGYEAALDFQKYIKGLKKDNIRVFPEDGCPGPDEIEINKKVVLVPFNTQWWLHPHYKPETESDCKFKSRMEIADAIEDVVEDNRDKLLIFATHHPLRSTGVHSGRFGVKQHIFPFTDIRKMKNFYLPLPLVGSLYPIGRNVIMTPQDADWPSYEYLRDGADELMRLHPNLVYIAGKEHNMELLKDNDRYYVVSGAASKANRTLPTRMTEYRKQGTGFAVMDITEDKDVNITYYEVDGDKINKAYTKHLLNYKEVPPVADDTAKMAMITADSFTAAVNTNYQRVHGLPRAIKGNNYRKEWAEPVKMKVFDLNETHGGFEIDKLGGGKQSMSLHLEDKDGKRWALRTLNKNVEKVMPPNFRNTFAESLLQDMISTAHPYGMLVMPDLMEAMNVPHPKPEIYFVPNDTAFGLYRSGFANNVCMLEEMEPSLHGEKVEKTVELFNKMIEKNDQFVDQNMFLRARLADYLVGDFDRHYDQWRWGFTDTGKGKTWYPMPRDRDQAFFYSDGALLKLLAWRRMVYLRGFKDDIKQLPEQAFSSRETDRAFLNELERKDWEVAMADMKQNVTNDVIGTAVHKLPPEIYKLTGPTMEYKLRSRRDILSTKGIEFYEFLAKRVNVMGTNKSESFNISGTDSGVLVQVIARDKEGDKEWVKYSRTFNPKETREVRLYGLNGDDGFHINENTPGGIRFRIIGGAGADTFDMRGHARNLVYDRSDEPYEIQASNRMTNMMSRSSEINDYKFREHIYNSVFMPALTFGYNPEDQFLMGLSFTKTTQGFRSNPYATRQRITSLFAFAQKAYQLGYNGEFNHIVRNYDLVVNWQLKNPVLDNFFGFGNETKKDDDKIFQYYRVRYSYTAADVLLRKRYKDVVSVSAGPAFYYYWNKPQKNEGLVLQQPSDVLLDSAEVYTKKMYAGGRLELNLNTLNSELLPSRGLFWQTSFSAMGGLNDESKAFTRLTSDVSIYAELSKPNKLVANIKFGGGHVFTDDLEYFNALSLGGNNFLRGYRKNRFTGNSMAYASLAMRFKLFEWKNSVVPGDVGIVGFTDAGRVWVKGETSNTIHTTYGGGFYFTPFDLAILSVTAGVSDEEVLGNFSLGAKFNINY